MMTRIKDGYQEIVDNAVSSEAYRNGAGRKDIAVFGRFVGCCDEQVFKDCKTINSCFDRFAEMMVSEVKSWELGSWIDGRSEAIKYLDREIFNSVEKVGFVELGSKAYGNYARDVIEDMRKDAGAALALAYLERQGYKEVDLDFVVELGKQMSNNQLIDDGEMKLCVSNAKKELGMKEKDVGSKKENGKSHDEMCR